MTIEEAKDEGAKYVGYKSWEDMLTILGNNKIWGLKGSQIESAIDQAIRIYASNNENPVY